MTRTLLALLLCAPLFVAACNTVEGVGEDVSDMGDAITEAAQ
jgi:predicted small secreted protein